MELCAKNNEECGQLGVGEGTRWEVKGEAERLHDQRAVSTKAGQVMMCECQLNYSQVM
jgi:hypothetical protein